VRGYEFEKGRYVLLDDQDFASARVETSSTMTVDKFIPRDVIRPIYFDTSYYMVPDGDADRTFTAFCATPLRNRRWRRCRGW
jgi:DNA end-binding protein Ku